MAEAPKRIEIPLTVEHDGETVEVGRLCYVREDVVEQEREKLRELVRAARRCIHSGLTCSECRFVAGGCTLESAMRELGVEVDA